MLCLPVLTALVSTPSLTLLTPLMHNSLLSHSNLLHRPSDNPSNLPSLLSDNLLPPLYLTSNPSKHNSNSQSNLPSFSNLPSNLPSDSPGSSRSLPNHRASSTSTDLKAGLTSTSPLRLYL